MCILRVIALLTCAVASFAADYATYIGDAYKYSVSAIATDSNGNTYVTGSRDVAVSVSGLGRLNDIFVSKLDPDGNLTLLATLSGKGSDQAFGIALDPSGNIYIVGATSSPDFPLHHPLQSTTYQRSGTGGTGFLVKLSADGTFVYSTYLGGTTGISTMNAVVADAGGNAYVAGETFASDYQHTTGLPAGVTGMGVGGVSAAFFAKISPAGDKILYAGGLAATMRSCGAGSSCFLSTLATAGIGIAVDPVGNAYIAGYTGGVDLPATQGALRAGGIGAFVAKVNATGTGLAYLTLLGGANYIPAGVSLGPAPGNLVNAITVDAQGNAYIAGSTADPDFPATPSSFQPKLSLANPKINPFTSPAPDAFVAKLNPTGSAMVWASFLGGTGEDRARTIATDSAGNVWVSGTTSSSDFPASSGFLGGSEFLAEFNPSGSSLLYAARFPANSVGAALAVDAQGVVHAAGGAGLVSTLTPSQSSAAHLLGVANAAGGDLGGRVAPGELISIYGLHLETSTPVSATFNTAGFLPTVLAGVQVSIAGTPAPLLYVSGTQINAVAPLELLNVASTSLRVTLQGSALPDFRLVIDPSAPQVFRLPDGSTAAVNQDGTINSQTNPAKVGSFVSIWATGIGFTDGVDGQMATAAQPLCYCLILGLQNEGIVPSYAGAAPGIVTGVVQINFQVTPGGAYQLSVSGTNSDFFGIFVKP